MSVGRCLGPRRRCPSGWAEVRICVVCRERGWRASTCRGDPWPAAEGPSGPISAARHVPWRVVQRSFHAFLCAGQPRGGMPLAPREARMARAGAQVRCVEVLHLRATIARRRRAGCEPACASGFDRSVHPSVRSRRNAQEGFRERHGGRPGRRLHPGSGHAQYAPCHDRHAFPWIGGARQGALRLRSLAGCRGGPFSRLEACGRRPRCEREETPEPTWYRSTPVSSTRAGNGCGA